MVARNNGLVGLGSFLGAWISTPCLIFTARIVFALFTIHQALRLHPFLRLTLGARGPAHVHGARVDAGQRVLEGQGEVAVFEVDQLPSIDTETDRSGC